MDLVSRISTAPREVGNFLCIYGPPGVGKTTFSTQAPHTLVLQVKDESLDVLFKSKVLSHVPNITADSWSDVLEALEALATQQHEYKTLTIDGASGLQEYCDAHVIAEQCDGEIDKFMAYGRGASLAAIEWGFLLNKIRQLVKEKKMIVIVLAHLDTITMKNPTGADYMKWRPAISKEKFSATNKYADAILLMDHDTEIKAEKSIGSIQKTAKATGGEGRILRCDGSGAFEAKNRLNLPSEIRLGHSHQEAWASFVQALKGARHGA